LFENKSRAKQKVMKVGEKIAFQKCVDYLRLCTYLNNSCYAKINEIKIESLTLWDAR